MATRVAVLEQESAEAHSLCHDQDARTTEEGNDLFGFASSEGISPRSSLSGAAGANLRARNDVLERKVDIMREQLEETKLELSAARKVLTYMLCESVIWCSYNGQSTHACGRSSLRPRRRVFSRCSK